MKIIIAGAGAVGTHLAKLLSDEKQDIILMDENEEKLSKLDSNFDLMTVNASPTPFPALKCRSGRRRFIYRGHARRKPQYDGLHVGY